ncbi:hypothetical protein [Pararcticibacter amylolyticus]|uniref:Sugar-binding protein n=1 Tax=Pararcticibacter amylolyticus TaxID=2173175 RepID=A0A2U2PL33_9SPHI|nr:hypothetical protein [Pararcticibacter amylolyticus]PWG82117.1 hypothetical protein DDR33_03625 [Pararcticibacter amylolyticus]
MYRTRTYTTERPLSEQEIAGKEVFKTPDILRQDDGIITHNIVTSQKVTEYFATGDSVVTTKDYRYTNNPNGSESQIQAKVRNITTYLNGNRKQEEYFTYSDGKYTLTHYPENLYPTSDLSKHPGGILTEHKTIIGTDTTYTRQKLNAVGDDFFVINPIKAKSIPGNKFDEMLDMKYNYYGNVIETRGLDGKPTAYIWSYNNQQVVAKVENATFQNISDALGFYLDGVEGIYDLRDRTDVLVQLNRLRELLPNALVYTYLYKPLVGMTSSTDLSGKTTNYEYDSSNRLKRTYFKEGNEERTIESHEYNLKK